MSAVRFLFDENVPKELMDALIRREPAIEALCVGQESAPPKGIPDAALLKTAEAGNFALITLDKRIMGTHLSEHLAAGQHTWGVFYLRQGFPNRQYVEYLLLIWAASEAEEWRDCVQIIP